MNGYDIIGDIHGQAAKLEALLRTMGYREQAGVWRPPEGRTAVFVGDLIDRGPEQLRVLGIVHAMQEAGFAQVVLGNHELNAIAFETPKFEGSAEFLRPHSRKNRDQHHAFLQQIGRSSPLHREYLRWFRTLPLFLELPGIRVVHAWWDEASMRLVGQRLPTGSIIDDDFLREAFAEGSELFRAVDGITKGIEYPLPEGAFFIDANGQERHNTRLAWWKEGSHDLRELAITGAPAEANIPSMPLQLAQPLGYHGREPVFFGHYWMQGTPRLMTPKVACLDWSAAKDGPLVAYRWDGEETLDARRLVWAGGEVPRVAA